MSRSNQHRVNNKVTVSRSHTEESLVCTQSCENFMTSPEIYSKGSRMVVKDSALNFHINSFPFKLQYKWFYSDVVNITLPERSHVNTLERLILSMGLSIDYIDTDFTFDIREVSFREILHGLATLALKDCSLIKNDLKQLTQYTYGKHIFEAYFKAVNGSGRISSKNPHIRWLNDQDTLKIKAIFFDLSDTSYQPGGYSMIYVPTSTAEQVVQRIFTLLESVEFISTPHKAKPLDFTVTRQMLSSIKLRDTMLLLSNCIGYDNGFIIRPKLTDHQYSRVYSIFTSISSDTRKLLGFTNYDIGSALQSICIQLVKDMSLYPLHMKLMEDKKAFRQRVATETGKDLKWVKTELSKIDNLDKMPISYYRYPTLKSYFIEAQQLREEIIKTAPFSIYTKAEYFAKVKWKKIWSSETNSFIFIEDGKKESSLFFFIWTQYERQIREVMMSCFSNPETCHQVHDAVYSTDADIDPKTIEGTVFEETGFRVQISKE